MIHKGKPYIGITDFTDFEQVEDILEVFNKHKPPTLTHIPHIGVMMSFKTLNGLPNRYAKVFPRNEKVADIFREKRSREAYYCLHYADYNYQSDVKDITNALRYAGPFVHALQLDMPWPSPEMIARGVRASNKDIEVILQVGRKALDEVNNDISKVISRLESYNNIIDRVLLDKSGGEGRSMDADEFITYIKVIKKRFPHLKITVAGGLGPNSIELVEPVARVFPDISIDAEAQLRPSKSILDPIDWSMARGYVIKALPLWG